MYKNVNYNHYHQQKTTCLFLFVQKAKKYETFFYTKLQTLSKNQDNVRHVFIYKRNTLYVTRFSWKCWNWHLYTQKVWNFASRDVFIYKKAESLQKLRQYALRLYTKSLIIWITQFFLEFLKLAEGGETFFYAEINALCVTFLYAKNALWVTFINKES